MSEDLVTLAGPRALTRGSRVGPWLILDRIDSGSYGVVFLVERAGHPEEGFFAMKLAKLAGDPRFEREAELLRRTQHPSLPRFEDFGYWTSSQGDDYPYVVMECVEGFTLYDWAKEDERSSRDVLQVLAQVARGLVAVHATGAVHRDVKGDNIRVTRGGRAVLVDFGAGWFPGARPLTDTCAPPGTTAYRSPELLRFMWRSRKEGVPRSSTPSSSFPPSSNSRPSSSSSRSRRPRPSTAPERRTSLAVLLALSWAGSAMVGGLIVLRGSERRPSRGMGGEPPSPLTEEVHMPPLEAPDAGVADAAMASAQDLPRKGLPASAIGLSMPKTPLPGQKKPPCNPRSEVVVIGACWSILRIDPPCGAAYEREGQCYMPVFDTRPPPTSEQP